MRCDECIKYAEVCHVCEPVRQLVSAVETNGAKPTLSDVRELLDAIYLTCDSYGHEDSRMKKTMSLYELRKVADRIKERVNFA